MLSVTITTLWTRAAGVKGLAVTVDDVGHEMAVSRHRRFRLSFPNKASRHRTNKNPYSFLLFFFVFRLFVFLLFGSFFFSFFLFFLSLQSQQQDWTAEENTTEKWTVNQHPSKNHKHFRLYCINCYPLFVCVLKFNLFSYCIFILFLSSFFLQFFLFIVVNFPFLFFFSRSFFLYYWLGFFM